MTDTLLWSLEETARQLGGISTRTVRRMIESGELSAVKIRRSLKIIPDSVKSCIDNNTTFSDTDSCMSGGRQPKGKRKWHTNEKTHRTGGSLSEIRAEKEFNALLEQRTARKRKR